MALGALIIKARLGLTDEEFVEQIKENPYLAFFIGLEGYQYSAPFDPSMMVYFRERLPESMVNDCNERIVRLGSIQTSSPHKVPRREYSAKPDKNCTPTFCTRQNIKIKRRKSPP